MTLAWKWRAIVQKTPSFTQPKQDIQTPLRSSGTLTIVNVDEETRKKQTTRIRNHRFQQCCDSVRRSRRAKWYIPGGTVPLCMVRDRICPPCVMASFKNHTIYSTIYQSEDSRLLQLSYLACIEYHIPVTKRTGAWPMPLTVRVEREESKSPVGEAVPASRALTRLLYSSSRCGVSTLKVSSRMLCRVAQY
jgi:hypothetical protein